MSIIVAFSRDNCCLSSADLCQSVWVGGVSWLYAKPGVTRTNLLLANPYLVIRMNYIITVFIKVGYFCAFL